MKKIYVEFENAFWSDNQVEAYLAMKEELENKNLVEHLEGDNEEDILGFEEQDETKIREIAEKHNVPVLFDDIKYRVAYKSDEYIVYKSVDDEDIYFEDIDTCDIPYDDFEEAEDYSQYGYNYDETVIILKNLDAEE